EGSVILTIEVSDGIVANAPEQAQATEQKTDQKNVSSTSEFEIKQTTSQHVHSEQHNGPVKDVSSKAHASPSIRRFARELGVNLDLITGSGPKHRILKEDVQAYVKSQFSRERSDSTEAGLNLLPWPQINFAKFGSIELKPLKRIQQIS